MPICCVKRQKHHSSMETEKVSNKHRRANLTDIEDSKDQLPDLPSEIIVDILSRLDVKSLLQFRCVQKSWASLVSDPKFVNTHMIRHSMKSHNIVLGLTRSDGYNSCTILHSISHNPYLSNIKLDFVEGLFSVYGSCNGLVCLVTWKDVYLWNPSTRESKRLPRFQLLNSNSEYNNVSLGSWGVFGFGYDYSKNDYKVVFQTDGFNEDFVRTQAHIYSVRTNSWRRIDPTYCGILGREPSKCINGIVHWVNPHPRSKSIVSFDLAKEIYGEVPQPIYGDESWVWSLGELEGSLCLLTDNKIIFADVWVTKEYSVNESWTKLFTISYAKKPSLYRQGDQHTIRQKISPTVSLQYLKEW